MHDAACVHLAHGRSQAIDEARRQLGGESARHASPRPVLESEGERVDAPEQPRHCGMTRERSGTRGSRDS